MEATKTDTLESLTEELDRLTHRLAELDMENVRPYSQELAQEKIRTMFAIDDCKKKIEELGY